MKRRTGRLVWACGLLCLLVVTAFSQEGDEKAMSDGDILEAVKQASRTGPGHDRLKTIRGSYEQALRWWPGPGAEARESASQTEVERIMDSRFLTFSVKGKWLGPAFEAFGMLGFDTASNEYVLTWADTLSTRTFVARGTCGDDGKIFTLLGEYQDPLAGKVRKLKVVLELRNKKGESLLEVHDVTAEGQPFKVLEADSKRWVRAAA